MTVNRKDCIVSIFKSFKSVCVCECERERERQRQRQRQRETERQRQGDTQRETCQSINFCLNSGLLIIYLSRERKIYSTEK